MAMRNLNTVGSYLIQAIKQKRCAKCGEERSPVKEKSTVGEGSIGKTTSCRNCGSTTEIFS